MTNMKMLNIYEEWIKEDTHYLKHIQKVSNWFERRMVFKILDNNVKSAKKMEEIVNSLEIVKKETILRTKKHKKDINENKPNLDIFK